MSSWTGSTDLAVAAARNNCDYDCKQKKKFNKLKKEIEVQELLHTGSAKAIERLQADYYKQMSGYDTQFDQKIVQKFANEIHQINAPNQKEMKELKSIYYTLVLKYNQDGIVIERLNQLLKELQIKNDTFKIHKSNTGYYAYGNKYDKTFKYGKDLAKWLNKEKAKYLGIDNR